MKRCTWVATNNDDTVRLRMREMVSPKIMIALTPLTPVSAALILGVADRAHIKFRFVGVQPPINSAKKAFPFPRARALDSFSGARLEARAALKSHSGLFAADRTFVLS